jgi:hypothetical protein
MISFSNPDGVHAPHGLYSHTATVPADTELVFVSGQVGVRPDGSLSDNVQMHSLLGPANATTASRESNHNAGLFLLPLRLCIEKVVHHRDDDGHALHQRDVCCVGQYGQSRC